MNKKYETIIVMDHYLPGRLAGGPVTTISNLVEQIGSEINALIVTRDIDLDGSKYEDVFPWKIVRVGSVDVIYLPPAEFTTQAIERIALFFSARQIYLNSFFSATTVHCLMERRAQQLQGYKLPKLILAPRGEFSKGAISLKARKKSAYLALFQALQLSKVVDVFQASSPFEKADIERVLGRVPIHIAPDVAAPVHLREPQTSQNAKLAFISRISPKKNLLGALDLMSRVKQQCEFDIYGPKEDLFYWQQCEAEIAKLPKHIQVTYKGMLSHEQVTQTLGEYSAFLFPTHGENFGHVIFEALAAGCPPLISDQTPWQDLETCGVGWVRSLEDTESFVRTIEEVLQEPLEARQERAKRCMAYAKAVSEDREVIAANLELFADQ